MMRKLLPGRDERPLSSVPRWVIACLLVGATLQGYWHLRLPPPEPVAQALPAPPPVAMLRLAGLGDAIAAAKLLNLWLQAFDNQPGVSIPFKNLDYDRVAAWLEHILALDPRGQYPLLAAIRLYGEVPDEPRQRRMIAFTRDQFLKDPNRRWPWLAHAVYIAKHRLKDLPLALELSQLLATHATDRAVPSWARQMHIFVLEDMGELESAKVLLGGLIASGTVTDPHELAFLHGRLKQLEEKLARP